MRRRTFLSRAGGAALATGVAAIGGGALLSVRGSRTGAGRHELTRGTRTDYPPPGTQSSADLVDTEVLWDWVRDMVGFGPRLTASSAHRRYLDMLEDRLRHLGMEVTRYPVPLQGWQAHRWSLEVVDARGRTHEIPIAYYRPHSGETPPHGVTAELVDVGAGAASDYAARDVRGRIVLADVAVADLTASVWTSLADYIHPPSIQRSLEREGFARLWLGVPPPPDLTLAQRHGAVAMVDVLDVSTRLAGGEFTPHQQVHVGLPTLHVDRAQGERLRALMKAGPLTATVVLDASYRPTTIDYLVAELPGGGKLPGSVLVMTHTDGQNAVEENGGPAILALAEYFSRFTRASRPRDLTFVFSPNHMTSPESTVKADVWLDDHPEIRDRITMALVPEHLGTMAWDDDPITGVYGPTGSSELAAIPVGNSDTLKALVIDEVKASNLARSAVVRPRQGGLYGEGTSPYRLGIPTVAYISGPSYLVQVAHGDDLGKLDPALLHRQTVFLTRVLSRMMALPDARP